MKQAMSQEELKQELRRLLLPFFIKEEAFDKWFEKENIYYNNRSPKEMIEIGKGDEVLKWIKNFR